MKTIKFGLKITMMQKIKRVYIALDSKALGDSLAWFPYLEEFRKQHQCELIVSTFMNDMFVGQYSEISICCTR